MIERLQLKSLAVSETGFVFDPRTGQSFTLNHTGMAALDLLRQGKSVSETADTLASTYRTHKDTVETCVESFVQQLMRYLS